MRAEDNVQQSFSCFWFSAAINGAGMPALRRSRAGNNVFVEEDLTPDVHEFNIAEARMIYDNNVRGRLGVFGRTYAPLSRST